MGLEAHPRWLLDRVYRRKIKTNLIHGVEIPALPYALSVGDWYYCANIGLPELFEEVRYSSDGCTLTSRMKERGLIYPYSKEGKEAAILHSKVMLGIIVANLVTEGLWLGWSGGDCPVAPSSWVDIKLRGEAKPRFKVKAADCWWEHLRESGDIVLWRVHKQ